MVSSTGNYTLTIVYHSADLRCPVQDRIISSDKILRWLCSYRKRNGKHYFHHGRNGFGWTWTPLSSPGQQAGLKTKQGNCVPEGTVQTVLFEEAQVPQNVADIL